MPIERIKSKTNLDPGSKTARVTEKNAHLVLVFIYPLAASHTLLPPHAVYGSLVGARFIAPSDVVGVACRG
jgi:hypothetical protein